MDVGLNSGIYKFLLVLHLIAVVVGFGGVMLNGVYAARAKRAGAVGAVLNVLVVIIIALMVWKPF